VASTQGSADGNATNRSTGVVINSTELTRALPLKQLRLITPEQGSVRGTDAVTAVFSRAVIALGSNFHGGGPGGAAVHGVEPLVWTCEGDEPSSSGAAGCRGAHGG
jgi:hypothetical protein